MPDRKRFEEMFEYARGETLPTFSSPLVVFGRDDPRVPHRAGELVAADLADVLVMTGSAAGKDAGKVIARGFRSEAHFMGHELDAYANQRGLELPPVILEEQASNGGENARFSLNILSKEGYLARPVGITAVAHATSARRLGATLQREVENLDGHSGRTVHIAPTYYGFNPDNPADRFEVADEIRRMYEFRQTGFGVPQEGLDIDDQLTDMVEFALDYVAANRPS